MCILIIAFVLFSSDLSANFSVKSLFCQQAMLRVPDFLYYLKEGETVKLRDADLQNVINFAQYEGYKIEVGAGDDPVCHSNCIFVDDSKEGIIQTKRNTDTEANQFVIADVSEPMPFFENSTSLIITKSFPWYFVSDETAVLVNTVLLEYKRILEKGGRVLVLDDNPQDGVWIYPRRYTKFSEANRLDFRKHGYFQRVNTNSLYKEQKTKNGLTSFESFRLWNLIIAKEAAELGFRIEHFVSKSWHGYFLIK